MVPGNHDVVRTLDSEVTEAGLTTILQSSDKVNSFIDSEEKNGISRVLPFKEYEKSFIKILVVIRSFRIINQHLNCR